MAQIEPEEDLSDLLKILTQLNSGGPYIMKVSEFLEDLKDLLLVQFVP